MAKGNRVGFSTDKQRVYEKGRSVSTTKVMAWTENSYKGKNWGAYTCCVKLDNGQLLWLETSGDIYKAKKDGTSLLYIKCRLVDDKNGAGSGYLH